MVDINDEIRSYQDYFEDLFDTLSLLKEQIDTSIEKPDELYKQLGTVEDVLETLLNWIKLQKDGLRNFETIADWVKKLAIDSTLTKDDIRSRMRIIILPQVESFTQNLTTGEKSALKVLDAVSKNLEELPQFLKTIQQKNFKLLSTLGYEPQTGTSHLDLALYNLYQGRFQDFETQLSQLKANMDPKPNNDFD
ncbi:MAG: hypothetical protein KAR20_15135 [Candidatus Heimdallarchaeota archaeon]|nr:hypothetical protein [Candidatus Heimdallarchaeota archaeon]